MEYMEWNAPFAGGRIPGYTKGICTTYIGDDGVKVGEEGDIVAGCDNVVYTYEGSAESIGDDSCLVGANVGHCFYGFCLHHVTVPD